MEFARFYRAGRGCATRPKRTRPGGPTRRPPGEGFARDSIDIEGYARGLARRRPDITLTILRLANMIGPAMDTALSRYLSNPVVPTVIGRDPRMQLLHEQDALGALDTGLAVGNLWYLNYSDRPACRMTGMTRFATFWVEKGKIVAPVDVLRFDDTLYRMFGDNLEALTAERELLLESNTYGSRTLTSFTLPGALLSELNYTL